MAGRPRKKIQAPEKQVEVLAGLNCSWDEIAAVLGISEKTARVHYHQAYKRGLHTGRASLKRRMWEKAVNDKNTTMMIWLSKNMLGYTDRVETQHSGEIDFRSRSSAIENAFNDEQTQKLARELAERLGLPEPKPTVEVDSEHMPEPDPQEGQEDGQAH